MPTNKADNGDILDSAALVAVESFESTMDDTSDHTGVVVNRQKSASVRDHLGNAVRWLSDSLGRTDTKLERALVNGLRSSTMFKYCSEASVLAIAQSMERMDFKKGDVLMVQGEPQYRAIVLVQGEVVRMRLINDQLHTTPTLGAAGSNATIGMLHLLREERTWATVRAVSNGTAFVLTSDVLRDLTESDPVFAQEIIYSLCREARAHSRHGRTSLFLQTGKALPVSPLPWFAISCAAAIESFYRSGLNSILNRQLTGGARGPLFPNMHIQLPSRILYINGFKGIRHVLDSKFDPNDYPYRDLIDPNYVGMGLAVVPGLIMSPLSSLLEASNAGHMNKEPMSIRWTRGLAPRCLREVIFGVGINQLSDYIEERLDSVTNNQLVQNLLGSLCAGIVAGYLSHVPHNLSALKVLQPELTYAQHFDRISAGWKKSVHHTFPDMKPAAKRRVVNVMACLFPKGCLIRTAQISGSFIIINAAVNALKHISVNVSVSRAGI